MIAAAHDAAPLRGFDRHFGTVDVGDDHIDALIDQRIDGLGLLDGIVPVAGDDDLAGGVGPHRARAHDEAIAVVEDEVERF